MRYLESHYRERGLEGACKKGWSDGYKIVIF